ncbi:translation initiation factor IF3 [Histoplasma capsulatum var. duboisii H88]|uniref:Translation initiation factor IF3 n=2 Tax=Ajellomyces capsulatus TaxID=5037 RepID=F0UAR0_AJEC8|nr:translation initiation factor IF3 [Histoplasma capsulatum H143]EGC42926.1 translation initiation factor IF3 [Histoplasma capsulatum var. duboisii H88]QSS49116.1 translation initiation factor IF3 [Histoplasma capsulatum var. duboisii H88]
MAATANRARSLVRTTQALRQICLPSADSQGIRFAEQQTRCYRFQPIRQHQPLAPRAEPQTIRRPQPRPANLQRTYGPQKDAKDGKDHNGLIKDEAIPARRVQIVNEDGSLGDPIPLGAALHTFDRYVNVLLQVAPETAERPAICKITSKGQLQQKLQAKSKAPKDPSHSLKQVELNWGIDGHDLTHRMKMVESYFEKGKKVEFILLQKDKRKKKLPAPEKARELVKTIKEQIAEMGAVETKKMEGTLLGRLTIYAEKSKQP